MGGGVWDGGRVGDVLLSIGVVPFCDSTASESQEN